MIDKYARSNEMKREKKYYRVCRQLSIDVK